MHLERMDLDAVLTESMLISLLETEVTERQERAKTRRLKRARFPVSKEWVELDHTLNPKIDFKRIKALFKGSFIEKRENVCLMGAQGTGKTHSLIALGRELCRQGNEHAFIQLVSW